MIHTNSLRGVFGEPVSLYQSYFRTLPTYTITTFDSTLGADVTKNPEIDKYFPRTSFSNQILEYQKKGSSILQFGNGNGPSLLIIAGIHGNEAESNISVIKYLEYMKDKNFDGTIYVIPFAIPYSTSINSRLWEGKDPNRIANIKGTPGWKIVQFAKNNGISHIIDVHSGGGLSSYSNGLIFSNISCTEGRSWAYHIRSKVGSAVCSGITIPGTIRIYANSLGIKAITLEVERDLGCTLHWANVQLNMIKAACGYLFPELI